MATTTPDYTIDYDDPRFTSVTEEGEKAKSDSNALYDGMINQVDKFYDDQISATEEWGKTQSQLQQERTDFTIETIEQKKEQANKDYIKEQSGAYVDYQKQINRYGVGAEKIASAGLDKTGYSESSQVAIYNTYQNRVATAREVYSEAVLNYNNMITEAQLQNNEALAKIAYDTLQKTLELGLQGFQYKNTLIMEKANKALEIDDMYYKRYKDVLDQINTENALTESARQFNENLEFQATENEKNRTFQAAQAELERKFKAAQAELNRKHEKEMLAATTKAEKEKLEIQYKNEMAKLDKQYQYELKLLKEEYSLKNSSGGSTKAGGSSSSSGGSSKSGSGSKGGSSSGSSKVKSNKNAVNTAYYSGSLNPDAKKYGTFSNGYQPKGISGHGTLSKTGKTIQIKTQTLSGQKQTVVQNVWKAEDGTKWYWEGRQNKYIQIK